MSQREAASTSVTDRSDISDDPRMHHPLCHYYQYQQVHSKGLRSEEQVKQRFRKDLIRKAGARRTQTDVIVNVEAQVTKAMSETGVVSLYLKKKAEKYASYKPLLKSFCHCTTTDKVKNVEQQSEGEETTKVTKASHEQERSIKEAAAAAHDGLKEDDELGHQETPPVCAVLLEPESTKETGLELSEDEEEESEEEDFVAPAAPKVNALSIEDYVNVETLFNEKKPNEENSDSSSSDDLEKYHPTAAPGLNISGSVLENPLNTEDNAKKPNEENDDSSSTEEEEDEDVENNDPLTPCLIISTSASKNPVHIETGNNNKNNPDEVELEGYNNKINNCYLNPHDELDYGSDD